MRRQSCETKKFCGSPKVTEGQPKSFVCSISIGELDRRKGGFFPGKTCTPFACKRNYFILQSETATFACWRKRTVECINVIKMDNVEGELFLFQLCFTNCESV